MNLFSDNEFRTPSFKCRSLAIYVISVWSYFVLGYAMYFF